MVLPQSFEKKIYLVITEWFCCLYIFIEVSKMWFHVNSDSRTHEEVEHFKNKAYV